MTLAVDINGTGSLTKLGTGRLALNNNNFFSGGVTLNAGTLSVGSNLALGSGTFTVGGGTLDIQDGIRVSNATDLQGNLTINVGNGATGQHVGDIGGGFGLVKTGAGELI